MFTIQLACLSRYSGTGESLYRVRTRVEHGESVALTEPIPMKRALQLIHWLNGGDQEIPESELEKMFS